jgi:hypothetical protein
MRWNMTLVHRQYNSKQQLLQVFTLVSAEAPKVFKVHSMAKLGHAVTACKIAVRHTQRYTEECRIHIQQQREFTTFVC